MADQESRGALAVPPANPAPPGSAPGSGRFRLMRYFTLATLAAFAVVVVVLFALQRAEETFFAQVQQEQGAFFTKAQATLARQQEEAARASLLAVHEASHVNLTRLVGNLLWASEFGPFVARAQGLAFETCRAQPADARRDCLTDLGAAVRSLPGFATLDAKAYSSMRSTAVFKIKVFDLRGMTVYSSEHSQIGEDGSENLGWRRAAAGRPASELTHRDRFSAFERVVENRDLISSYVPVRLPGSEAVVGVFELYSDVTPFLAQTRAAAARFSALSAANEADVRQAARDNEAKVDASSERFLLIVLSLLALLYAASLLIVRYGQRIIDRQTREQALAAEREHLWHREKMAALATMAANVSHEVGNPLAVIAGVAQGLPEPAGPSEPPARMILEQTARIAAMMRRISDFASSRGESPEWVDLNAMVKAVCDFHAFDRRFRHMPIEFVPGPQLPAQQLVPDHLNEVMMSVLQGFVEDGTSKQMTVGIRVQIEAAGAATLIRVGCKAVLSGGSGTPGLRFAQSRFEPLRRRVAEMGGTLVPDAAGVCVRLSAGAVEPAL